MADSAFLPFASDDDANVASQSVWAAYSQLDNGFTTGILYSLYLNKALRQGTFAAAVLMQVLADYQAADVSDDGDLDTAVANLKKLFCHPESDEVTEDYTVLETDRGYKIIVNASSSAIEITIPISVGSASTDFPFECIIQRSTSDTGSNSISIYDDADTPVLIGVVPANNGQTVSRADVSTNGTEVKAAITAA